MTGLSSANDGCFSGIRVRTVIWPQTVIRDQHSHPAHTVIPAQAGIHPDSHAAP
ncbi:MAG: hypothetical protein ACJARL_000423 [Halopseudomonas sp.]|jgi:hypothetical protein